MDTNEYIKSLEARIEELEKRFDNIVIQKGANVVYENCTIQGVGIEKAKKVDINNCSIQGVGVVGLTTKISNSNIHNLESAKTKTKIKNCKIENDNN